MKLVKIADLFEVKYGVNLELINLDECEKQTKNSINFISRTEKNNGISAYVQKIDNIEPNPAYTISVAGGGSVLATFFQQEQYYSGRDIYILIPKRYFSEIEMIFYAYCIRKNKYRYNYGRQANKTLPDILIPEVMPIEWKELKMEQLNTLIAKPILNKGMQLNTKEWKWFDLKDFFDVSASRDSLSEDLTEGGKTPYVTSSETNNGITSFFQEPATNKAGTITANRGGSVGYFFYQPVDYMATPVDVRILSPKFKIDPYIGLFVKTVLQLEKYRYNYSRKMGTDRLNEFRIKLPKTTDKQPDWDYMRNYIKTLPYSSNIN
jgi:hypothetical protein